MAFNEKGRGNLRDLVKSKGHKTVMQILTEAINKGEIKPEELSLQELWNGFTDYAPVRVTDETDLRGFVIDGELSIGRDKLEAVGTGSFEKITGALISKIVIDAYDRVDTIWQNLVTVRPGKLKKETITGMTAQVFPLEVPEGTDYKGSGIEEKYVTIKTAKVGRFVEVTEEMILMDQTGDVLDRANMLGELCAQYQEKLIVEGVQDINSNVWNPGDSAEAIYANAAATANHPGDNLAANNAFSSAGLAAIEKLATNMIDNSPDQNYILVNLSGKPALFPVDLMREAWEFSSSPTSPDTAERAPGYWRGKFVPMTSPYIGAQSTTTWYWGDFKKSFIWVQIWPLQVFTARAGNYREFEADIKSRHKVRFYGGVGARDYVHVYKSTA